MTVDPAAFRARLASSAPHFPPAPLAAAPASLLSHPSSGARGGAGDLLNGGVFERPACVARLLRRQRWREAAVVLIVAAWIAAGVVALVALLGGRWE